MDLGQLKATIDALHELHGPNAHVDFLYQFASGRTKIGKVTSYQVFGMGAVPTVRFAINYARGANE